MFRNFTRLALLHNGTLLGGAVPGAWGLAGFCHNYDGELCGRLDVVLEARSRVTAAAPVYFTN